MKLKMIALAAALVATATAASAANSGDVFLNAWDATGSYSKDLGITTAAFDTALKTGTYTLSLDLSADTAFQAFVAAHSIFSWDVLGAVNSGGFSTVNTYDGNKATVAITKTVMSNIANQAVTTYGQVVGAIAVPDNITSFSNGVDAVYNNSGTNAIYAGTAAITGTTAKMVNYGTAANNSFASGLGFIREAALATGLVSATQTPYNTSVAYLSGNTFAIGQVAAVPEADSLAMLLAGLGMVGSIVTRRNRKTA